MDIRIVSLKLRNFKGVKDFFMEVDGNDATIYGDNAAGKTTIYDGLCWLLFDKDSHFRSQFEIKTLDRSGEPLHGLEHEVEGVFLAGDERKTLRKVFAEKWTKKRGSAEKQFTGHTTKYWVDGVPVKKSEYTATVKQIADENVFKLLTSPSYFAEKLHWQDRRRILLDVCGDITDDDVIAYDPEIAALPVILDGRNIDDHRKIITARRSEINDELEKIPVRIDEVEQGLPDTSSIDVEATARRADELKARIKELEQEYNRIQSGGEIAEKIKLLREAEADLLKIRNEAMLDAQKEKTEKQEHISALRRHKSKLEDKRYDLQRLNDRLSSETESAEKRMEELRAEWNRVSKETFQPPEIDTVCPTCGQDITAEEVEEAKRKALDAFMARRAERLADINAEGKSLKNSAEENKKRIASVEAQIKDLDEAIESIKADIAEAEKSATQVTEELPDTLEYKRALAEKERLEREIEALQNDSKRELLRVGAEIDRLSDELELVNESLAALKAREDGERRIAELKEEERELAAEYESLERELYLMDRFVKAKVALLEDKINSRFKLARFKLFQEQINGGVKECCDVLYKGVPYSGGLNNAARINVGLDIIATLAAHYGVTMPVFIDNAESITELLRPGCQLIRLVVSADDKSLRVEVENG